jgi:hypothetical protein
LSATRTFDINQQQICADFAIVVISIVVVGAGNIFVVVIVVVIVHNVTGPRIDRSDALSTFAQ